MTYSALIFLVVALAVAIPVAAALGFLGVALDLLYSRFSLTTAIGELSWATSNNFLLVAIPFFVLLGEILMRSGVAERMYGALALWTAWLPGGLMHANIAVCAVFAATSGSSVATAATVGTVAMAELDNHGYSERLFLGTIAAGGTLGILIPPSINMIVYGALTDSSIPKLYLAGIIPGVLMALFFSLTILGICLLRPRMGGRRLQANWGRRVRALADLAPPLVVFGAVVGSIYAGWATATESAALGVIAALGISAWYGRLSVRMLLSAFEGTMRTTAMIMAILIAAYFLNFVISSIGLTAQLTRFLIAMDMTPSELFLAVVLFYLVLGMFMETLSMMVATVPTVATAVIAAGYDRIWFGIIVVILMEVAMITPPVGVNLYVVQGLRRTGKISDVIIGALPFVLTMLLMVAILWMWPALALWLPGLMHTSG